MQSICRFLIRLQFIGKVHGSLRVTWRVELNYVNPYSGWIPHASLLVLVHSTLFDPPPFECVRPQWGNLLTLVCQCCYHLLHHECWSQKQLCYGSVYRITPYHVSTFNIIETLSTITTDRRRDMTFFCRLLDVRYYPRYVLCASSAPAIAC